MRSFPRLRLLAIAALLSAGPALAQDYSEEEDYLAAPPPEQTAIDWSVGLRGSYAASSLSGGRASLSLTPEASLTIAEGSGHTVLSGGAELVTDSGGGARAADIHAGVEQSFRLSTTTLLEGALKGAYTQADKASSGLPANTLQAPPTLSLDATGSVTQDFGKVDTRLTLEGRRYLRGPTTLTDLSTISNVHQSYWQGGATLRVGYELTPLVSAFVEGEASVQKFDAADPTLLRYLDGRRYELRTGLSYAQGSILAAEASVGRGWLDYFDGALTDTQDWVYNGSLTLRPDETISLRGALETTIGPSSSVAGDTDVAYALTGTTSYQVNPWLALRGSAGWKRTVTLGTGGSSTRHDFGAGLDLRSSRHVIWTADYAYARDDTPPTPSNDTHTVTIGVRVTR